MLIIMSCNFYSVNISVVMIILDVIHLILKLLNKNLIFLSTNIVNSRKINNMISVRVVIVKSFNFCSKLLHIFEKPNIKLNVVNA